MSTYAYIVDAFVNDPKYRTEMVRIEARVASLGLTGRWEKMTILKNIVETTKEAVKRGATTVVIVGNDETVTKVLPVIVEHNITLGLIPIGPEQTIASALGVPSGAAACDCLSRRIVQKIDVGQANSSYFLMQVAAPAPSSITCDGTYTVSSLDPEGSLAISNLRADLGGGRPNDGRLELVVQPKASTGFFSRMSSGAQRGSVFPIRKAKIEARGEAGSLVLDGHTIVKSPLVIDVLASKLSVIVGPHRQF